MLVVGLSGEALMGATPIAIGLEAEDTQVVLAHVADEQGWAVSIASWCAELEQPVEVRAFEGDLTDFDTVVAVGTSFSEPIPDSIRAHPNAIFALVAAGVNASELPAIRARLLELGGLGALTVDPIARFERVGRAFVELVEHVHHLAGPTRQSRVADTLRAALFGRSGLVAVNLASREDPPLLDPLTTMVFYVDLDEV